MEINENETVVTEETIETKELSTEDAFYPNQEKPEAEEKEEVSTEVVSEGEEKAEINTEDGEAETEDAKEDHIDVEYKLALEENSFLDNSTIDEVTDFAKENNLSNDMAQEILSRQEQTLRNWIETKQNAHEEEKDGWRASVIEDKTMGGDNLKKTVEVSRRLVERYASEDFISMLRDTGYGDHPEVVKFFYKVGSAMSDDSLVLPKAKSAARPVEDLFYGTN